MAHLTDKDPRSIAIIPPLCRERFFTTTAQGKKLFEEARINFAGISQLLSPYEIRRWNSWHHVLLFTLSGRGTLKVAGKVYSLSPGSLCVLPANVDHHYFAPRKWKIIWFHPDKSGIWDALAGRQLSLHQALYGQRIYSLGEILYAELSAADPESREAARMTFQLLIHYLHREFKQAESPGDRSWRLRLETLWDIAFAEPARWNVTSLAAQAHCSRSQLHSVCKRLYGLSARDKLVSLRLQKAADHLLHTPWSLQDIAERVGYADAFAFSKAFRRLLNMPPARYRREFSMQK